MAAIELKDQQRKYFGLAPVDKNWDRITFPKGLVCYFDQNVIKKVVINSTEYFDYYSEFDTEIQTNDRSKVIPVSGKGKEKSISLAVLADYSLKSVYPIIGNIPLDPDEIVFPMHYGSYVESSRKGYYFGWGMIMVDKVEKIAFKDNDMDYNYRNNGVAFGASLYQLEDLRNGLPPYDVYDDINHPDNIELKQKIFASLGVPLDIDYDDYCLKSGVMTRAELLKAGR